VGMKQDGKRIRISLLARLITSEYSGTMPESLFNQISFRVLSPVTNRVSLAFRCLLKLCNCDQSSRFWAMYLRYPFDRAVHGLM